MKKLYVELANTPIKREKGLMGRKKIGQNDGMLFNFPYSRRLSFWMSNTYIPLDIAFIDEDGVITEIKEMIPMSTRAVTSMGDCKYALEVNKGWFAENEIKAGSKVSGIGIRKTKQSHKIAQIIPPETQGEIPVEPGLGSPPSPQEAPQQDPSMPDVVLDKTHKEMIEDANLNGKDLIIIYQIKEREGKPQLVIGPKTISPPFVFEEDTDGNTDAIVKAWDNQDAGWKSFLIDNIIDLEEKEAMEEKEENLIQEQEINI